MSYSLFLLCVLTLILLSASPASAFGAGNIPSYAHLEGKAFRHGDLEDILSELAKKVGGAAGALAFLGAGKFGGLDVKRVYFGNWLRDYSQAMDVAGLSKLAPQAIINLVMILGFLAHGYATGEFEVTEQRLGVYLPVEHIDNPKGYNDNKDARQVHPGLRGPIDPAELEIDSRTGMKNYIANEQGHWPTSSGLVRQRVIECIEMGRRARQSGRDADLWEAYRLLGTFLHTLEDLTAHSNWCELSLVKMGHRQVYCHVGDNVRIHTPHGNAVSEPDLAYKPKLKGAQPPLVTGTFGGADFMHSLLGEATDHISEASVSELNTKVANARSAPADTTADTLRDLIFQIPGSGNELSREMDGIQQMSRAGPSKDPNTMSPQELHAQLWRVLTFRDHVMMAISSGIEKVPGLSSLLDRIGDSINKFVMTTLEPYIKPIMQQATGTLQQGSQAVVNNEDQFETFNNPQASDPTHSMLSKDHFANILNEPAGLVAGVIVRFAVKNVVQAWDNNSIDPRQTANLICTAFHHPYYADPRSEVHQQMRETFERWFRETDQHYTLASLTKDACRAHKNVRKGHKAEPHSHGGGQSQYNSFLPAPEALYGSAQHKIQGYAHQAATQIPGYSTYQNLMTQSQQFGRRDMDGGGGEASNYYSGSSQQPHQGQNQYQQPSMNYNQGPPPQPYGGDQYQQQNNFSMPAPQHFDQGNQYYGGQGGPPPGPGYGPPPQQGGFGMPEPQYQQNSGPPPGQYGYQGNYQQQNRW